MGRAKRGRREDEDEEEDGEEGGWETKAWTKARRWERRRRRARRRGGGGMAVPVEKGNERGWGGRVTACACLLASEFKLNL